MKKLLTILVFLLIFTGCNNNPIENKKEENSNFDNRTENSNFQTNSNTNQNPYFNEIKFGELYLQLKKKNNCSNQITEYYHSSDTNMQIYLVCLTDLKVSKLFSVEGYDKVYSFNEYLLNYSEVDKEIMSYITNQMEKSKNLENNVIVYKKDDLTIIECNNNKFYIGDKTLNNYDNYC